MRKSSKSHSDGMFWNLMMDFQQQTMIRLRKSDNQVLKDRRRLDLGWKFLRINGASRTSEREHYERAREERLGK
jgi:hypothetical protein